MKVIGINASPRKKANTQTLVENVLAAAVEKGAETRLVHLREMNINGCIGCNWCRENPGRCAQKDELTPLMQEMAAYDAVVMGTPVYWYQVTAQFKMLVDRLYSYVGLSEDPATGQQIAESHFPADRKMVIILSRGAPEPPPTPFLKLFDHLNEWITLIPGALGLQDFQLYHQYGSHSDPKAALNDAELLEKARSIGFGLCK